MRCSCSIGRHGDIAALAAQLAGTDLRPGRLVDDLFGRLVEAAVTTDAGDHGSDLCPRLFCTVQQLCARGEGHLEWLWAERVLADPAVVERFPYLDNYRLLAEAEYRAIRRSLDGPPGRLVFVGSGPLPLTAVLLSRAEPDLEITCVDRDAAAVRTGKAVAGALSGGSSKLRFVHADAGRFDYSGFDIAVLAALVGTRASDKAAVLAGVARSMRDGALLAARSVPADGRRLLYPRIEPAVVPAGLAVLGEWAPPPGVINSLLLMRVDSGSGRPGALGSKAVVAPGARSGEGACHHRAER